MEEGKLKNPGKFPGGKARNSNKLNPRLALGQSKAQATLVGVEHLMPRPHWLKDEKRAMGPRMTPTSYCTIPDPFEL